MKKEVNKRCSKCKEYKPLDSFNKSCKEKSGLRSECRECQRIQCKKYREENKEKEAIRKKKYVQDNKGTHLAYQRKYDKRKRDTDPLYKMKKSLRNRTKEILRNKGWRRDSSIGLIIGANWEEVKEHIENQFTTGMTWENHGDWHYDHIIPLDSADTIEQLEKLSNYKNIQPLWASENIKKSNKLL